MCLLPKKRFPSKKESIRSVFAANKGTSTIQPVEKVLVEFPGKDAFADVCGKLTEGWTDFASKGGNLH